MPPKHQPANDLSPVDKLIAALQTAAQADNMVDASQALRDFASDATLAKAALQDKQILRPIAALLRRIVQQIHEIDQRQHAATFIASIATMFRNIHLLEQGACDAILDSELSDLLVAILLQLTDSNDCESQFDEETAEIVQYACAALSCVASLAVGRSKLRSAVRPLLRLLEYPASTSKAKISQVEISGALRNLAKCALTRVSLRNIPLQCPLRLATGPNSAPVEEAEVECEGSPHAPRRRRGSLN